MLTRATKVVLILVLMEDTLGAGIKKTRVEDPKNVLILVLMEDTLGVQVTSAKTQKLKTS